MRRNTQEQNGDFSSYRINVYLPTGYDLLTNWKGVDYEASIERFVDMVWQMTNVRYPGGDIALIVDADGHAGDWNCRVYRKARIWNADIEREEVYWYARTRASHLLQAEVEAIYRSGNWMMYSYKYFAVEYPSGKKRRQGRQSSHRHCYGFPTKKRHNAWIKGRRGKYPYQPGYRKHITTQEARRFKRIRAWPGNEIINPWQ